MKRIATTLIAALCATGMVGCSGAPSAPQPEPSFEEGLEAPATPETPVDEQNDADTADSPEQTQETTGPSGNRTSYVADITDTQGYKFRMTVSVAFNAYLDVANAPPGKAHVRSKPEVIVKVENMTPGKNYNSKNDIYGTFATLLTKAGSVACQRKENGYSANQGAAFDAAYCTIGKSYMNWGVPDLEAGQSVEFVQGPTGVMAPGRDRASYGGTADEVTEAEGPVVVEALNNPVGIVISNRQMCVARTATGQTIPCEIK